MNLDTVECQKVSVLIIGAGISGVACANHLIKNGCSNFKLVDAKQRIGGRISTVKLKDNFAYEEGAQWIHGTDENPIKDFVDLHGIEVVEQSGRKPTDLYCSENYGMLCSNDVNELIKACYKFGEIIDNIRCADMVDFDATTQNNMLSYVKHQWQKYSDQNKSCSSQLLHDYFVNLVHHQLGIEGCNSLEEVSLTELCQYRELAGGNKIIVKGFSTVVDLLASVIPPATILLEHEVTNIEWNSQSDECSAKVTVFDKAGSTRKVMYADHVVVTVPLGVLKNTYKTLFKPQLPARKVHAISKLGFGNVVKVMLCYDIPFWSESVSHISVLWDSNVKSSVDLRFYHFFVMKSFQDQQSYLVTWTSGEEAKLAEQLDPVEVGKICTDALVKTGLNVPEPKSVFVTPWNSDPYTLGSYTFLAVGSSAKTIDDLVEPLPYQSAKERLPVLLFAGEATHRDFYSTTHGAYASGIREAERLLEIFKM